MHLRPEFVAIALEVGILLLPIVLALGRYVTLTGTAEQRACSWLEYVQFQHPVFLGALVTWCALAGPNSDSIFPFAYWILPFSASVALYSITGLMSRSILQRRWALQDRIRLIWWSTVHPVVTLLMIAVGFQDIFARNLCGVCWLGTAGSIALLAIVRLRYAQGFRLRRVKSGTLYARAMHLAKRMGIRLKRIYVVPPGRGSLTNAFATSQSVGLTDNFGEYLYGPQLDFVIAHELAHVKRKHMRKKLAIMLSVFLAFALLSFMFAGLTPQLWWLLKLLILSGALLIMYAVSRRFEYEADRDSALFTGNPEAAIRALVALYRKTRTPMERARFLDLFATHPGLRRRAFAIARVSGISDRHVTQMLTGATLNDEVLLPSR
jgi:Zn-dependent protease with chaperone function